MPEEKNTPTQETIDAINDVFDLDAETENEEETIELEAEGANTTEQGGEHASPQETKADNDLMEKLQTAQDEATKNMAGWQRTLAEFQNYKRRTERERSELTQKASLEALTKILPIMDDFERALLNIPEELQGNPWMNGVELILGKFNKLMDDYDVTAIDPVGERFDPNLHQAIGMDDSDEVESGHVIETLQKGFQRGDVLLRPALVRVAN